MLESRHLVSLFLGVVLLCGVFFTLGYVMGHNQYGDPVHAAASVDNIAPSVHPSAKQKEIQTPPAVPANPANTEWDFYSKKNNEDRNGSDPKTLVNTTPSEAVPTRAANSTPAAPVGNSKTAPTAVRFQAPRMVKGSVVLQIAALTHESDALAMADALQQKHFPSFVVTPSTDNFYRVQVGPYQDEKAAESAKAALDHAGFIAIIKR